MQITKIFNGQFKLQIVGMVCLILLSCQKKPAHPSLTTAEVTEISQTSAISGGEVIDEGDSPVTSRGICWSFKANPTIDSSRTIEGGTTGVFLSNLSGLSPNTLYYVRSYATNGAGTGYGNQVSFSTSHIEVPSLTTKDIYKMDNYSVYCGGTITDDHSGTVISRGVCWSKSHNPTIADNIAMEIQAIPVTSTYSTYTTWTPPNTTYYFRAFATNSAGTGYGNEIVYTTTDSPTIFNPAIVYNSIEDIEGNVYKTVVIGSQTWMAENLRTTKFNDGSTIPLINNKSMWKELTTAGFSWPNYDDGLKSTFGGMYNYYAVSTGKLCPSGWHVPDKTEMTTMMYYLGGVAVAGGKLKESGTEHWRSPNVGGSNESGFTAIPSSYMYSEYGELVPIAGTLAFWWLSGDYTTSFADVMDIQDDQERLVTFNTIDFQSGVPVRCIKN